MCRRIVVDGVSGVKVLTEDSIREASSLVTSIDTKSIVDLTIVEQQLLILVEIEQRMSSPETRLPDAAGQH